MDFNLATILLESGRDAPRVKLLQLTGFQRGASPSAGAVLSSAFEAK
jgi:hypothetical protein